MRTRCDFCHMESVQTDTLPDPAISQPLRICEVCDELGLGRGTPEAAGRPATRADLSRALRFLLARLER